MGTIDNNAEGDEMEMDTLVKQSLEAAISITGKDKNDEETQKIAFKLACAVMAQQAA